MTNCYVMTRSGQFISSKDTPNQCVKIGKQIYEYEVKLLFRGDIELDENGFIIRHEEIDEIIQKLSLSGSCEEMHKTLSKAISQFFQFKLIGYKAVIKPPLYKNETLIASLDYCWINDSILLPLLK